MPEKVAIIGFGKMGRQIAQLCAQHGHDVKVTDSDPRMLELGMEEIWKGRYGLEEVLRREKIEEKEALKARSRIRTAPDIHSAVHDCTIAIEAVYEDLELKTQVFQLMDKSSSPGAILASNTSTLGIGLISQAVKNPHRVLGMHFFNPAQVTKLIELVRSDKTSPDTVRRARIFAEGLGKKIVECKDSPGFLTTRLGLALYLEASKMLDDGVGSVRDIDLGMRLAYGHPMGPFELADLVGLDSRLRNLEAMAQATGQITWSPPRLLRKMIAEGYLGGPLTKPGSKGGYYEYFQQSRIQVE